MSDILRKLPTLTTERLDAIDHASEQVGETAADVIVRVMGVEPSSSYFSYHQIRQAALRAATLAARTVLLLSDLKEHL